MHLRDAFNGVPFVVGVSGHRSIGDEAAARVEVRKRLESISGRATSFSELVLLTGLAEGADQLAAEVALDLNWTVVAVLPMAKADYLIDFETTATKSRFLQLLARCQHSIELQNEAAPSAKIDRVTQYCALGHFLTRHAQLMLLLWDGVKTNVQPGGTAWVREQCLGSLRSATSPLDRNRTSYIHIPVTRQSGQDLPPVDQPLANDSTAYLQWEVDLKYIAEFNADCVRTEFDLAAKRKESLGYLIDDATLSTIQTKPERSLRLYAYADSISTTDQVRRKKIIRIELALLALSAIAASIYSGPHMAMGWLVLHLSLLAGFIGLYFRHFNPLPNSKSRALSALQRWFNFENLDTRYLDYRAFAEGLRVQIFWQMQGLRHCVADHYVSRHHQEIRWVSVAVRNASLMDDLGASILSINGADQKKHYSDIVGAKWIQDQSNYYLGPDLQQYAGKYLVHQTQHEDWDRRSIWLLGFAIALTLGNLCIHETGYGSWFDAIPGEMPLNGYITWLNLVVSGFFILAGTFKAYDSLMGNEERANNYKFYGQLFRAAQARFVFQNNANYSKQDNDAVVYELGKSALAESADWLIKHRKQSLNIKDQL